MVRSNYVLDHGKIDSCSVVLLSLLAEGRVRACIPEPAKKTNETLSTVLPDVGEMFVCTRGGQNSVEIDEH